MSVTELKERIYEAVDSIDDPAHLCDILIVATSPEELENNTFSLNILEMLEQRRKEYSGNEAYTLSWGDLQTRVKEYYNVK